MSAQIDKQPTKKIGLFPSKSAYGNTGDFERPTRSLRRRVSLASSLLRPLAFAPPLLKKPRRWLFCGANPLPPTAYGGGGRTAQAARREQKEAIYHHLYENPQELDTVMREYIHFYNEERPHRKLNMKTPLQFETEFFKRALK